MICRPQATLGVFLLSFAVCLGAKAAASGTCDLFFSGGVSITDIPLANSAERRGLGLSGREHAGNGMFFSWDDSEPRAFTMRDVGFPLSIGFLSDDGILFAIDDMAVGVDKFYLSMLPARNAIELPHGQFAKLGLAVGSRLVRRDCVAFT